MINLLYEYMKL